MQKRPLRYSMWLGLWWSEETDGLVASMMARTAVLSALLNVKINLGSIKDEEFVARMAAKVAELEKAAMDSEKAVMELSVLTRDLV